MATALPNTNINIPYSAFLDPTTGRPSQPWLQWLMNPSVMSINIGSAIGVTSGGTGLSTIPTNGQLLIGNGTGYTLNTLGFGAGISVTNGSGTITVANTGVLSFSAGTTGLTPSTATTGVVSLAGTLIAVNGGTGFSSYAVGDLLYANTTTTLAKLPDVATGNALISGGVSTAPTWGKIGLTTHVSGILPIANGGTNSTATPTAYGISYGTGTAYAFTAAGSDKQVLKANTGAAPTWTTLTTGTSILYGDNTGGFSNVTIGSGVSFVAGTLSAAGSGGTVTSVSGTGTVSGISLSGTVTSSGSLTLGGTLDLSSPPAIGSTAANTGAFTTLSASSTISGTGFSTYLASPPAIGGTTASTGRFTTVTSTVATGTAPFTVASTTAVANLSIGGNAGTVTNGVYTTDTGTVTNTMLAGSITNAKLVNSSITFGSTAQALGSTVSAISGVTIDNGVIGGTIAAAGTFTTLIGGSGSANYEQITGGATGKAVQFQSLGSDAAVSLAIQSKGTGAIDLAAGSSGVNISNGGTVTAITRTNGGTGYTVAPTVVISAPTTAGGVQATATCTVTAGVVDTAFTITNAGSGYVEQPTITFTPVSGGSGAAAYATVGSGTVVKSLGSTMSFYTPGGESFRVVDNGSTIANFYAVYGKVAGQSPTLVPIGSDAAINATIASKSTGSVLFRTDAFSSNAIQMSVSNTASAVNYVNVTGGATGVSASISSQGSDASVGLIIQSKSASILFLTRAAQARSFNILDSASPVNYLQVQGSLTTVAPILSAQGTDADVSLSLVPKGLGIVLMNQQTPAAVTATGTLTIANLLTQIITSTSAIAVALTLPTGTLSDAGVSGGTSAVNTSFEYSIINLGSAVGDVTMVAGTAHTIVGSATVAVGTSGRFRCRKTATNTFVSYRV